VILRATSILGGQKEDKGMMCSITHNLYTLDMDVTILILKINLIIVLLYI
jgi:hypothetical protein